MGKHVGGELEKVLSKSILNQRKRLANLAGLAEPLIKNAESGRVKVHEAGMEYTSLMVCFLLHNISAAKSLLVLYDHYGNKNYPATVGYNIARTMFEIDVTAHYISKEPSLRAGQYIDFGWILKMRDLQNYTSPIPNEYKKEIERNYKIVQSQFEKEGRNGKKKVSLNWSGLNIREMAACVGHEKAYLSFYSHLSSYAHADIRLSDSFIRLSPNEIAWSSAPGLVDTANVFWFASNFMNCYLKLFGKEFNIWKEAEVEQCETVGEKIQ